MTRRGLTMIELLLALGLLGIVTVVGASWISTASGTSAMVAPRIRWQSAAEATLQLIDDDLRVGDLERERGKPRVEVLDGRLLVHTRDHGEILHEFDYRPVEGELRLKEATPRGQVRNRLLLDEVKKWECTLDAEAAVLEVRIESRDGIVVERRYRHAQ